MNHARSYYQYRLNEARAELNRALYAMIDATVQTKFEKAENEVRRLRLIVIPSIYLNLWEDREQDLYA
jgi:hypothetical protein